MRNKKKRAIITERVRAAFLLAAVVAAAFLIPQAIFLIQDRILYGRTELGRQESADIELLGSNYEQSMHQRMLNFTEGLEAEERFYVTARQLADYDMLQDYLYSEKGIYQNLMGVWVEMDLLYYNVFWDEYMAKITQWKQYVIYSDDYAKGVNFILWYIELRSGDGTVMKLLTDAETGMLYALKTEGNSALTFKDTDMGGQREARYWELFYEENICRELLAYLMVCYEAQNWEELVSVIESAYEGDFESRYENRIQMEELIKAGNWSRNGERNLLFQLPYGGNYLDYVLEIGDINIVDKENGTIWPDYVLYYPDVTIGVRKIIELIPEFL